MCIYAQLLPRIRAVGKQLGYAIAIHGSMQRDFDLLATPWVPEAASAEELVAAIAVEVGGFVVGGGEDPLKRGEISQAPTQ